MVDQPANGQGRRNPRQTESAIAFPTAGNADDLESAEKTEKAKKKHKKDKEGKEKDSESGAAGEQPGKVMCGFKMFVEKLLYCVEGTEPEKVLSFAEVAAECELYIARRKGAFWCAWVGDEIFSLNVSPYLNEGVF
jgi:hypothetical protein